MHDTAARPAAPIIIGEVAIGIEAVIAVARDFAPVALHESLGPRLLAARAVVLRALERGESVYGLTTGLGAAVDTRLSTEAIPAFQARAIRARAVGVGELMTTEEVRALLFARLVSICHGASGLSPVLAATIAAMINAGVHPVVRRIGSLGEADLSPLAQAFLPLVGAGEAEFGGTVRPGGEAMTAAGIALPELGPKDGLALLNANSQSVGLAALAVDALSTALQVSVVAGALSLEGFRANLSPLDADLAAMRGMPGHSAGADRLRALLAGSDLFEPGTARKVQDPLSFRCLAPVAGHASLAVAAARAIVEAELASVCDSPAVLVSRDAMLSSVNFDTTELALTLEAAGLALAHLATTSAARVMKLMSPSMSDLPRFLTRHGGSHSGFATSQKTVAALEAEIRHLALPLGGMTLPVADGVEDYAPMTPRIVEKTHAIARRLTRLAAIELVVAAEAVDLRGDITLGRGTAAAHVFVRRHVARLDDDRPMGREYEALALTIEAGGLAWADMATGKDSAP
ncbi:HAL/PAL/TAL family ammonia-lyase [Bosea lathyri]|uniref:Histidine ammonia-lyase n=1 Tax=Bosea lathyri TaxID=1036778 RepID=A0A1H6C5T1_9HYPH|nr:aromatic amino acid lyase [Bosea lathyri]SEG68321.1 histidine ammonia-lyase [Bosea lathyri]